MTGTSYGVLGRRAAFCAAALATLSSQSTLTVRNFIRRSFIRIRPLAPIIAIPILSLVNSMILLALLSAIRPPVVVADPLATFMPGAVFDTMLGILFGPLIVSVRDRRTIEERVDW